MSGDKGVFDELLDSPEKYTVRNLVSKYCAVLKMFSSACDE